MNSRFPEAELEKEREVVLDEIASYRDAPSEAVYDDFEDMVYADTPLGHNILGTPQSVRSLGSNDCRTFLRRNYTITNSVLFYSGRASARHVITLVEKYFANLESGNTSISTQVPRFVNANRTDTLEGLHQAHTVLGIEIAPYCGEGRWADALFCNIIGGPGMNSLLNVELRERRGLVYNVEASIARFAATGLLTVYYGCDPDDNERCRELCIATCAHLADMSGPQLARLLHRAKRQYLGQMAIASENRENRLLACSRAALLGAELPGENAAAEAIQAVTADDIRRRARAMTAPACLTFIPV